MQNECHWQGVENSCKRLFFWLAIAVLEQLRHEISSSALFGQEISLPIGHANARDGEMRTRGTIHSFGWHNPMSQSPIHSRSASTGQQWRHGFGPLEGWH